MSKMDKKAVIATVAGVAGALALGTALAGQNPFAVKDLGAGYVVADSKAKDGKCGEGKCGGKKDEKATDGKATDGKCGGMKGEKAKDGKCGEGKCGGKK